MRRELLPAQTHERLVTVLPGLQTDKRFTFNATFRVFNLLLPCEIRIVVDYMYQASERKKNATVFKVLQQNVMDICWCSFHLVRPMTLLYDTIPKFLFISVSLLVFILIVLEYCCEVHFSLVHFDDVIFLSANQTCQLSLSLGLTFLCYKNSIIRL